MSKIFDASMFFNELDMVELRLNMLHDVVDYFVIVEAAETHSGMSKPYNFDIQRFEKFAEQIVYIQVPSLTAFSENSWHREKFHRSCIQRGLVYAEPDDWIVVGDADEIINPDQMVKLKEMPAYIRSVQFELTMFYYNFHNKVDQGWSIGAARKSLDLDPNDIRRCTRTPDVRLFDSGYHLSYFGGTEQIIAKHDAFMHRYDPVIQDLPHDAAFIEGKIEASQDLYGRNLKIDYVSDPKLPEIVQRYIGHYQRLGWV